MSLYAAYINKNKAIFSLKQVKVLDETTLKVDSLWRFTEGEAATDCLLGLLDMDLTLKKGKEYARYSKDKDFLFSWLEGKREEYINEARDMLKKLEVSEIQRGLVINDNYKEENNEEIDR